MEYRFDQRNEIGGGIAGEGRFGKMRVGGDKVLRGAIDVGEVAASAAGDENLFPDAGSVVEQAYPAATLAGLDGAHQSGGAGAQNDGIKSLFHADRSAAIDHRKLLAYHTSSTEIMAIQVRSYFHQPIRKREKTSS